MPYKPFYISSFENESGLDQYSESFLIPEKAFPTMEDAYAWRGRIKRRRGFEFLGRLRRCLEDYSFLENGASPWSFNIKVESGYVTAANNANPGQITTPFAHNLMNGDIVVISGILGATGYNDTEFTVTVVDSTNFTVGVDAVAFGAYASGGVWISNRALAGGEGNASIEPGSVSITLSGPIVFTDNGDGTLTGDVGGNTGVINYATGAVTLTHTAAGNNITTLSYCYFPTIPVMGLLTRESSVLINDEELIAFDTKYAYQFTGGKFQELVAGTEWTGTDSDFFWSTNFRQNTAGELFWVTNFSGPTGDPIRYYDGTAWTDFLPTINGTNELHQSLILLPYKDRLLAMNTWEGATLAGSTNFAQRVRFSENGDPTDQADGWRDDIVGRGGFSDIPTNEAIVSAEFIKDTLLIKCERSSWKVVYTGNEILPFVFQQINTELGAESTFSLVPFDRGVFAVGNYGITGDDSVNVARIDQRIPDIVFSIHNENEGVERVYGIRNYQEELVYWAFPNSAENPTYPNKILVYNYRNQTYSIFNDSFTCFGYFQRGSDLTWATLGYPSWADWNDPWNSGLIQSKFPDVIGGNQQGYVEVLNRNIFNDVSLSITSITPGTPVRITVPNHNLQTGRFVKITGIIGSGTPNPDTLNDVIYRILKINDNTLDLQIYDPLTNKFDNVTLGAGGTYLGGGNLTVLNNINILTKRFSPYYEIGGQVRLGYVDFFMEKTEDGEFTVNLFVNENSNISINDPNSFSNEGVLGDNIVLTRPENLSIIPFQANQEKIWHRLFAYSVTQNFQLQFTLDDAQMSDQGINSSEFILHAMVLYMTDNIRLIQ